MKSKKKYLYKHTLFYVLLFAAIAALSVFNIYNAATAVTDGGRVQGIAVGVGLIFAALFVLLYLGTVLAYTSCYSRVGRAGIIVFVVASLFVVRLCVRFAYDEELSNATFGEVMFAVMESITLGGGSTVYEWIGKYPSVLDTIALNIYVWMPAYTALVIITVISFAIDYPMLCTVRTLGKKYSPFYANTDVFIFNSITQETVLLAKDIKRQYAKNDGAADEYRGKRALILFYGKDIEGFDKKNNLHRELQSNHFIYISYNHRREMKVAEKYGEEDNAQDSLIYEWSRAKNVHYFAFDSGQTSASSHYDYKSEDANAADAFAEIAGLKFRLEKKGLKYKGLKAVYVYVLSENDADYPTYNLRIETLAPKKRLCGIPLEMKVINEAERATWELKLDESDEELYKTAENIANNLRDIYAGFINAFKAGGCKNADKSEAVECVMDGIFSSGASDDKLKSARVSARVAEMLSGQNAEEFVKEFNKAYNEQSAFYSEKGKALFDKICAEYGGLVSKAADKDKEPFFTKLYEFINDCAKFVYYVGADRMFDLSDNKKDGENEKFIGRRILCIGFGDTARKTVKALYANNNSNMLVDVVDVNIRNMQGMLKHNHRAFYITDAKEDGKDLFGEPVPGENDRVREIYDYSNLLTLQLSEHSALEKEVSQYIDDIALPTKHNVEYDALIIAMGDDERNLAFLRSFINDMIQEAIEGAVAQNNNTDKKIDSYDITKLKIFVHLREYDNRFRLYWNQKKEAEIKWRVGDKEYSIADYVSVRPYGCKDDVFTYNAIVDDAEAMKQNGAYNEATGKENVDEYTEWFNANIFNKWSSKVSKNMYGFYEKICNGKTLDDVDKFFIYASGLLEHRRWCRFMMSNGYVPIEKYPSKNKEAKDEMKDRYRMHGDIRPYSEMTADRKYNEANIKAYMKIKAGKKSN